MANKKPPVKMCLKCREVKPVQEFYPNSGWGEQSYADLICRECAKAEVVDKDTARRYFWQNNRVWNDAIWESAKKKADRILANNQEYLNPNTSGKKRTEIENRIIGNQVLGIMNMRGFYSFVDNGGEDGVKEFNPDSLAGTTMDDTAARANEEQVYSEEWGGMYTLRELKYLDRYLERLQDEFVLDNVNIEDYARRVAKASLIADTEYEKMRQGRSTMQAWEKAQMAFDHMSKSANFAECQRKETVNGSMGALSTIIMDIELNHHNEMPQIEFPPDDVDKILNDFGYTGVAVS